MREMAMAENEDYLKYQRQLNTLLAMPFYVNSTSILGKKFGLFLTHFYQILTEFIVIIVTAGQFLGIPVVFENMNILCGVLSSGSHSTQVVLKTFLLNYHKKQYANHLENTRVLQREINTFENFVFRRNSSGFAEYHSKQSRYVRIMATIQFIVNFVSTCAYFLPFVYDSIVNHDDLDRQLTPVVFYIGMDFKFKPLFQVIVFTVTVGFFIIDLKCVVIDFFILHLIVLHLSQLKYHNNLLRQINKGYANPDVGRIDIDEDTIKNWIKKHQSLLRLFDDFSKLMSPYLFLEFSYILVHTCVPAFVITSTFSWTLAQKISVFFMVGGSTITFFLMSYAADSFDKEWQETGVVFFDWDIVPKKEKLRKDVYLMIRKRVRRPFSLRAFNAIPLSSASFLSLLRLIFSYYMALSQIQKLKRHPN